MTRMVRFSPGNELRRLQREMDQLFDSFSSRSENGDGRPASSWTPRTDLAETEEEYLIHLDVPGVSKEDFDINFQDGTLTVRGVRKADEEESSYVRVERASGPFYRSYALPESVDADAIRADYRNGVLTLHVPKAEASKPRRIEVQ